MPENSLLIIGSRAYKKSTISSFLEESKKLFARVLFVPIDKIRVVSGTSHSSLLYKDKSLADFDVCYPRLSPKDYFFGQGVLRVIEGLDLYCPVTLRGFFVSHHKYYTTKVLSDAGIPVVKSTMFISSETARESLKEFGLPVVVKIIGGFAGKGVVLVDNAKQFESVLDTVQLFEAVISAQKFVPGKNSDIRCYVIGEKVIAVKRTGRKGEWRANISRGGTAKEIDVTKEMKEIALKAARVMQLDICSVDFMDTSHGLAVVEVNFMPGPFKKYLGNRITKEMVEYLHKKAVERKS